MSPTAPHDPIYICGKRFPEIYTCNECLFRTDLYIFYNRHVQSTHRNRKLNFEYQPRKHVCSVCRYVTHSSFHWLKHRCEKWYKCDKCPFANQKQKLLNIHLQNVHKEKMRYKCNKCSFASSRLGYLNMHKPICDLQFAKRNVSEVTGPIAPSDSTYACGRRFPELYTCIKCLFRTDLYVFYNKHAQLAHQNRKLYFEYQPKKYVCPGCRYVTHSSIHWVKHQYGKWYICPFLSQKQFLNSHRQKTHYSKMRHKCSKCSFTSSRLERLKIHKETEHREERWYKCEECPFGSSDQDSLRLHVRRQHLDKKWYQCGKCAFKTLILENLEKHVRSKHKH